MDSIKRKFIHAEHKKFEGSDGKIIEYYPVILTNVSDDVTDFERSLTINFSKDLGDKLGFQDSKVIDSLRGRNLILKGVLFTINGKLRFSVKEIDVEKN